MDTPKKFNNVYFLWLDENREFIKKMYFSDYELKIKDNGKKENLNVLISKKAGEVWKSLDESVKETYKTKLKQMNDAPPSYETIDNSTDEEDEEGLNVVTWDYKGKTYLMDETTGGDVYDYDSQEKIGTKIKDGSLKIDKGTKKINSNKLVPSGFAKPTIISQELCDFLGKDQGTEMSRTEVTKELTKYIKSNNLQDEADRRKILPDKKLTKLLNVEPGQEVTYFNLQKYMKVHFPKPKQKNTETEPKKMESKKSVEHKPEKPYKEKRKNIPQAVKKSVWRKYITTEDPKKLYGNCFVNCGKTITIEDFDLGHVIPFSKGGEDNIDNLRPICRECNLSMGTMNLDEFKEKYGFNAPKEDEVSIQEEIFKLDKEHQILETSIEESQSCNEKLDECNKEHKIFQEEYNGLIKINTTKLDKLKEEYEIALEELTHHFKCETQKIEDSSTLYNEKQKEIKKNMRVNTQTINKNNDQISLNQSKLENVMENKQTFISKLNHMKKLEEERKQQLMLEIEEEVKADIEKENMRKEIRKKLMASENLIDLN